MYVQLNVYVTQRENSFKRTYLLIYHLFSQLISYPGFSSIFIKTWFLYSNLLFHPIGYWCNSLLFRMFEWFLKSRKKKQLKEMEYIKVYLSQHRSNTSSVLLKKSKKKPNTVNFTKEWVEKPSSLIQSRNLKKTNKALNHLKFDHLFRN